MARRKCCPLTVSLIDCAETLRSRSGYRAFLIRSQHSRPCRPKKTPDVRLQVPKGPCGACLPSKHHRTPPRKPPEPYPANPATRPSSAKFQHLLPTVYLPESLGTYLDFAPHPTPGIITASTPSGPFPLRLSCPTRRRNIRHLHPHPHLHLFYILCPPRKATLLTSLARP